MICSWSVFDWTLLGVTVVDERSRCADDEVLSEVDLSPPHAKSAIAMIGATSGAQFFIILFRKRRQVHYALEIIIKMSIFGRRIIPFGFYRPSKKGLHDMLNVMQAFSIHFDFRRSFPSAPADN
jgi:hypothetical protein